MGQKKSCNTDNGHEVEQDQLSIWIYHVRMFFLQRQSQHPGTNPLTSFCSCSWWTCRWSFFCFDTHVFFCVRSRLKDWCFGRSSCGGCWKMSLTSNLVSPNVVTWHDWYCWLLKNMNMHQWVWQLFHPLQIFNPFKGCMVSSRFFH